MDWAPGYRELAPPAQFRDELHCLWVSVTAAHEAFDLGDGSVEMLLKRFISKRSDGGHGFECAGRRG